MDQVFAESLCGQGLGQLMEVLPTCSFLRLGEMGKWRHQGFLSQRHTVNRGVLER